MNAGFTGTRSGMTPEQKQTFADLVRHVLCQFDERQFHHGDCIGADADAHNIAVNWGEYIVVHPPIDPSLRAFCKGDEERPPLTYFARNRKIVDECGWLIATPWSFKETEGGTWYTINYARKHKKPVTIIWPDGTMTVENWDAIKVN